MSSRCIVPFNHYEMSFLVSSNILSFNIMLCDIKVAILAFLQFLLYISPSLSFNPF